MPEYDQLEDLLNTTHLRDTEDEELYSIVGAGESAVVIQVGPTDETGDLREVPWSEIGNRYEPVSAPERL